MFDYSESSIIRLSAHQVGSKAEEELLHLSKKPLDIEASNLRESLLQYFLSHFKVPEFYSFSFSDDDLSLNPVYKYASKIFDEKNDQAFHSASVQLAKHLYNCSDHPNIKSGDFYVAHFSNVNFQGENTEAIGIFKAENKDAFLKLQYSNETFQLSCDNGININKADKSCLIFKTDRDEGFKVCIIDRSSKASAEAQYWKDRFLYLRPCGDDYHYTKNFMSLTKNYVSQRLPEDFEVSGADRADYLNRSMDFFKNNERFDEEHFEKEVLQHETLIDSFKKYKEDFEQEQDLDMNAQFSISAPAVKKQSRIFKSVLKLDKNFHVYIHGNRDLIEHGVDEKGRKFYKIYYSQES
ncbi:MAG: nucleoid-associated protein [Chitinophagales bacterium]